MQIEYVATEFAGDPPRPIARWYKIQSGTHARYCEGLIDFFYPVDLKVEQSVGTMIHFVKGDGDETEIDEIVQAWENRVSQRS
jgi:hypothetical protein